MRVLLGIIRLLALAVVILLGVLVLFILFPLRAERAAKWLFTQLRHVLLFIMGVKVEGGGWGDVEPGLIMANHRSYLDVLLVPTKAPLTFVAKREVKKWPLIGQAASALGTVWVKRESKESRTKARKQIIEAVSKDKRIVIFPEGTSWEGPLMLPIRPAMFYECAEKELPIYIWSLHYTSGKVAFPIGVNFLKSLWTLVCEPRLQVYVDLKAMPLRGNDPEALIEEARQWWEHSLLKLYKKHPVANELYWNDDRISSGQHRRL